MISISKNKLSVLQFDNLSRFAELFHFTTTRGGGCSTNNYSSLNLGFNSGDLSPNVIKNRTILCDALEINLGCLIFPKQTHTATVKAITAGFFDLDKEGQIHFLNETDAVITDINNVCVAIKTADCVPVLLFDSRRNVVAAVHAGWRGTVQDIVLKTILEMTKEYGTEPSDIFAGIGPSISPEVYEVGEEVWKQFTPEFYSQMDKTKPGKRLLNLWSANFQQLIASGVPAGQVEISNICTFSEPDLFFSARRDGQKTGRMAAGIMIKKG
jgi:polyphenol oxidase